MNRIVKCCLVVVLGESVCTPSNERCRIERGREISAPCEPWIKFSVVN